ncbi:MAG: cytochrome c biogenesis protein CcdA [Defluviitaleaceae bacterium]|nr:cytochrome c biogenesis protein CcdA [Defluviitaleaceae bacterium]
MIYFLLFIEGIISFISPCLLPLVPVYVSYFAGGGQGAVLRNAICFVVGFTAVFVALGAFAGAVGGVLVMYAGVVNLVAGGLVVLFGLDYLFEIRARLGTRFRLGGGPPRFKQLETSADKPMPFYIYMLFGGVFSIVWAPCVSRFLGAALMRAATQASVLEGMLMLLVFSLGLAIPFVASALLIKQLKEAFDFIKRHMRVVNIVSGLVLVATGLLIATGLYGRFVSLF